MHIMAINIDLKGNTKDLTSFAFAWQLWKILNVVFSNIWKVVLVVILLSVASKTASFVYSNSRRDATIRRYEVSCKNYLYSKGYRPSYPVTSYCREQSLRQYDQVQPEPAQFNFESGKSGSLDI